MIDRVNREQIIDGLRFTVEMMMFNPITGEGKTPESLNDGDKTTYDACIGAIKLLQGQEPIIPIKIVERGKIGYRWKFYCGKCKYGIDRSEKYCSECGSKVKWK